MALSNAEQKAAGALLALESYVNWNVSARAIRSSSIANVASDRKRIAETRHVFGPRMPRRMALSEAVGEYNR